MTAALSPLTPQSLLLPATKAKARWQRLLLSCGVGALMLLLTACSPEDSSTAANSTTAQHAAAAATTTQSPAAGDMVDALGTADDTVNVALYFLNYSLDPKDYFNGWILVRIGAGETLLRLDDQGQVQPLLARDFTVLNPTTYQLRLDTEVRFADGSPLTATDVKHSLERAWTISPRGQQYFALESIECHDAHTVVIHTQKPVPELFYNLCEPLFTIVKLPPEALPQASAAIDGATTAVTDAATAAPAANHFQWPQQTLTMPITTGPYKVTAFVPNNSIEVQPNPYYQRQGGAVASAAEEGATTTNNTAATTASVATAAKQPARIRYFYMADAQSRVMALQAGEVDLIPTVDYAALSLFTSDPNYQVLRRISPRTNVVYLNHDNELLALPAVRQAIDMAINREQITQLIGGSAASGLIAPEFVHGFQLPITYDPLMAAAILDEAGIVDSNGNGTRDIAGKELSFRYCLKADHGSADSTLIAQSLQQDLEPLGIELKLLPSENLAAVVSAGDFDFYSANDSTVPTGDPYYFISSRFHTQGDANYVHYENAQVDALLDELGNTFEPERRQELTTSLLRVLSESHAALFINHIEINEVARSRLENLHLYAFDYYFVDDKLRIKAKE